MALIIEMGGGLIKDLGVSGILGFELGIGIDGAKGVFTGGGACGRESATTGDIEGAKPL